ncbi:SusC/RagA family TonB-linked outer membrane protein [Xylanibacter muris]|uniref:SusC/RagA family TonB-linked outer membrane protein n=1 Tax=Xylanibacter muris TaxID=2736290 RepID=A0ABX2APQ1_9BACT|nr:SusC/RagA family TonB-linked outer membrane protein [Xylanibacter muris]NPD92002.1 SusC/RagA family TonB-linked outer membrane protein [Xylanibacter muris]
MKRTIFNIQKSFLRNALCLTMIWLAMPVAAQDYMDDEEPVAAPKKPVVYKEKYPLMTVKGKVFDEASKKPLGGVQLKTLNNARYTAMTDEDGSFSIKVPVFTTALYVYTPDYLSQQVAISGDTTRMVSIYMINDKFKSMYADGTTITSQRSFTSSATNNLTVDNEIQSQLGADIRSIQRSAAPAIGNSSFIRGISSINSNSQPLVIVDGIELDQQLYREALHTGQFNNMLGTVMPADIDKVTVLKNGTALYGARGANGVILIDTKRGHSMATRIEANISVGLSLIPKLPTMMDATQYRNYATEMMGTIPELANSKLNFKFLNDDPTYYYYHMYHNNTDWSDEAYRTGLTQNYSINVQGGDDVGMYNLSVGYVDGKSTAEGNDYDRMNVRFNTDIDVFRKLKTKFDLSISRSTSSVFDDGIQSDFTTATPTSPTFLSLIKSPLVTPYQYNHYLGGFSGLLSDSDDLFTSFDSNSSLANPTAILKIGEGENKNYAENTNFQVKLEPTYKITNDLSVTTLINYSLNRHSQRYFRPTQGVPVFKVAEMGTVMSKFSTLFSNETNIVSNTHVDYTHSFGAHYLKAYAGFKYSYFSYKSDVLSTQYRSAQNDKNPTITANKNNFNYASGVNDVWKQMQWYGNVDYNYMNRYFLTLSLLGEANSRFGENCDGLGLFGVQWAIFPSIQAGWVVSNEKWFPKNSGINYLRINAGYDISGNDDIDITAARSIFSVVKFLDIANGLQLTNIGNDKIQWENTKKFNVGFEANMLHNRLSVAFDYFINKTDNLLTIQRFKDPIAGINHYWTNGGELKNTGFELAVSGKPVVSKDWNVEVGATVGHYKNEVVSLPEGDYVSSIYGTDNIITSVGNPVAMFYGYKTDGVLASDAAARTANKDGDDYLYMKDASGNKQAFKAGDMRFVDIDGDGFITESDRTIIGDPNPDAYGNIFANVSWKNFTLSMNFNYSIGNDVYNYQRMILNSGSNFYNQQVAMTNHWRYEGQETSMPRINYGDPMANNRFSDRWIEDGSYLRLKTLRLTYRVPVNFSWLQGVSVWAEGVNLFTLTKYLGSDPEFSVNNSAMYQGIDCGNLAQGRAFTFGLKINL